MTGHLALCDFVQARHDVQGQDEHVLRNTRVSCPRGAQVYRVDMRVDWWSFGVLLYEMLAGLLPFYDGQFRARFLIWSSIRGDL
jgi:serum/glucocorticoid-regulated kinase 2